MSSSDKKMTGEDNWVARPPWLTVLVSALAVLLVLSGIYCTYVGLNAGPVLVVCGSLLLIAWGGTVRRQMLPAAGDDVSSAQERLDRVTSATQDGVWEFDTVTKNFFCSEIGLRLARVSGPGNTLVRAFLRRLNSEQRRRLLRAVREAWNERGRFDELVHIAGTAAGQKRWLRVRAGVSQDRRFVTGALSDVSDEMELTRERGLNQSFIEGVMDSLPLAVSVKNAAGIVMLTNRAYCEGLQVNSWELLGKTSRQIVPDEIADRLDAIDRLTLETGRQHTIEDWFDISRIKRRVFLRITKCRCVDRSGQYVVVTTFEDQSEVRGYANKMANLSMNVEAFVQRLIRTLPNPIYVKNAESRYVMANAALGEQWGMRVEDMIGMSSRELFGEEIGGAIEEEDRRVLAGETVLKEDCVPYHQSGHMRYWSVSKTACTDVDGNRIIVGTNFEITGLRDTEIELRAALARQTHMRQFLQHVFDALPHPMFVKDRQLRFLMTNRALSDFHGCSPDQIVGKTAFDLHDEAAEKVLVAADESVLEPEAGAAASMVTEVNLQDAQGGARQFLVRRIACSGMDGEPVIVGIAFDVTDMRKLEADLRSALEWQTHNLAFLQDVFDAIPTPISVKNEQHRYVMANQAMADAFGMTREEMLGKTTRDVNLPEVATETMTADDRLFAIGPGVIAERNVPIRYADGRLHRIRLYKSVCLDPDGARLLITSNSDVTELVEKEDALIVNLQRQTRTREFLQTVFDMLPFATYVKDDSLRWVLVNTALSEFFGQPRTTFVGRPIADFIPASEAANIETLDRQLLANDDGELISMDFVLHDHKGRERCLVLYEKLVRDAEERPVIIGIHQDVTELREIQRHQVLTLERLDTLIDNAPLGITMLDSEGCFLRLNPTLQQMLRCAEADLVGHPFLEVVPADERVRSESRLGEIRSTGVMLPGIGAIVTGNGGQLPVLISGIRAAWRGDTVVYWLLLQDLIEQKIAEQELLQHRDRLQQLVQEQTVELSAAKETAERSSAAKSDFIALLSHEMRTPLHAILSFARLGSERGDRLEAGKIHDYFIRIGASGERLLKMLDDLLDLAKLEAGRTRLETVEVDLTALLDEVTGEFEALLVASKIDLSRIDSARLPIIRADAPRIGQVVRNLLSNAVKFSPQGTRITVRTGLVEQPGEGGEVVPMVELVVMDEGPGIPEAELDRIFDRFTQSSLTRSVSGGTGLGLAICREIVLAHRGSICARNGSQGGAEFIVRLPLDGAAIPGTRSDA